MQPQAASLPAERPAHSWTSVYDACWHSGGRHALQCRRQAFDTTRCGSAHRSRSLSACPARPWPRRRAPLWLSSRAPRRGPCGLCHLPPAGRRPSRRAGPPSYAQIASAVLVNPPVMTEQKVGYALMLSKALAEVWFSSGLPGALPKLCKQCERATRGWEMKLQVDPESAQSLPIYIAERCPSEVLNCLPKQLRPAAPRALTGTPLSPLRLCSSEANALLFVLIR